MGSFSIWHWLIVLVVVLVLFGGGGKISRLMGDFGRGLKSFKKNIKEDENPNESDPQKIDADNTADRVAEPRSEEQTSELQSLMRISYAVFCLKKKKKQRTQ